MSRIRAHHKTRSGCKTCKRRKVKCDEEVPICKNCTRRGVECVWSNTAQPDSESSAPEDPPSTVSRRTNIAGTFDLLTLELIHHYATSTSHSLSSDPAAVSVWQTVVPKIAFSPKNQCLLHAILAMSALHTYHADPTAGQYAVAASTYHWQAKMGLHKIEKDDMVDINMLFVTVSLVALYEFATTSIYSSEWHTTARSMPPKVARSWPQLWDGILSPVLTTMAPTLDIPLEGPFSSSLSALLSTADSQPDVEELQDSSVYITYKDAIRILGLSWRASFQKNCCIYASCMWWALVPKMFLRLLGEGKPRALIILAHYCVMMKRVAEDGPWWAKKQWGGEAAKILSALDTRWTPLLGWLWSQLEQPGQRALDSAGMDFMDWLSQAVGEEAL
ncbi:hypothetical protein IW261DRAFT_1503509 [Armillaria novae-zelandiae]|uniref:Zn(2)-C6 fungal-type domain-containing protein n=1 Tax=Armillaria novae-zelandiae TaxID=153914 RepID=A0AA39UCE1_9AGAR|nr:hypothetical protein IW261DRAFT_1503509 [Armillaria novae-zelandiae]